MSDDDEYIDMYESRPGHWEHRPPPAFPNPRPFEPEQPDWAREMHANAAGCMPFLWFVLIVIGGAALLIGFNKVLVALAPFF